MAEIQQNDPRFIPCSDIFKSNKLMDNFQEFLTNIFFPLFEVTNNPKSHPELHMFLQYVSTPKTFIELEFKWVSTMWAKLYLCLRQSYA